MSDYPKEFEEIWKNQTPSRLDSRKLAGFAVYSRMNKRIKEMQVQLDSANTILKTYEIAGSKLLSRKVWEMGLNQYLQKYFNKPNKME